MTETRFTAWASTRGNDFGADPGISITESAIEDGNVRELGEVASDDTDPGTFEEDGEDYLDVDTADAILEGRLGYRRTSTWVNSGNQCAAVVEKITSDA